MLMFVMRSSEKPIRIVHLGLTQHAGSMMPGILSFLSQSLLSMSFRIRVIHQNLCPVLQISDFGLHASVQSNLVAGYANHAGHVLAHNHASDGWGHVLV